MAYRLTIPSTGQDLVTQDMILSLLAKEYPLTAKQLTYKIKKQFGKSVTYQAVYKAINTLLEENVLEKDGTNVRMRIEWIRDTKAFIDRLQRTYLEGEQQRTEEIGENVQVYHMDNLIDLDKFWIKIFEGWFDDPEKSDEKLVQLCGHAWYILGQLENEEECLRNIKKHGLDFYTLVDSNTPLDQWSSKYYTDWGFQYATKKDSDIAHHNHYYIVYDDMIMESVYPQNLARDLDSIYECTEKIGDLDLNKVIKILRRKEDLKITVMQNRPLAAQLRKGILSHF